MRSSIVVSLHKPLLPTGPQHKHGFPSNHVARTLHRHMCIQRCESNYVTHVDIQIHICDVRLRYNTLQHTLKTTSLNISFVTVITIYARVLWGHATVKGLHSLTFQTISLVTIVHGGTDNNCNVALLQIMGAGLHTQCRDDKLKCRFMDEWLRSCALLHVSTTCFHKVGARLHC